MSLLETPEQLIAEAEAALGREELEIALRLCDAAEQAGVEPDRCAGNRWFAYMLLGELQAAWRESDAIRRRGAPDPHRFWQGEELRGKRMMLRSLHGFGDAVQMFRFLPRLQALASHLVVEVPPRLVELAPYFAGMGEVITWGEQAPPEPPAWDVQMEVMELPYALRVGSADLQPRTGYLHLPETVRGRVAKVIGPERRVRVGVVWTAGHWNPSRSIPVELVAGLGEVSEVEFWNLQGRHGQEGLPGPLWRDVEEVGDGILPLAALVERMDLLITVDTLAAHLAGALGRPCWLLLQERADWRWMCGRADSPWYPTLRLMRQPRAGDWACLLAQVLQALRQWAGTRAAAESC